jgi:adenylate cyclase
MESTRLPLWRRLWRRGKVRVFIFCLAWATLVAVAQHSHLRALVHEELASLDFRFRLRGGPRPLPGIVILAIDQRSMVADTFTPAELSANPQLAALKNFPFPRSVYADAIEKLCAAGAKKIALDLLFVTPKGGDDVLRAAIAKYRDRVVLGANYSDDGRQLMLPSVVVPETVPTESVAGFVNYWPDSDQVVRRMDTVAGSFPALAAGRIAPPGLINFAGPGGTFPTHPFYELFYDKAWEQNLKRGEVFRDQIVLIGPTGNYQHDQHPTPFSPMDGVEIHANAIGTLLRGDAPREASSGVGFAAIYMLALATALLVNVGGHPLGKLGLLTGMCLAYVAVAQVAFASAGIVILVAAPLWTVAGGGVAGIAAQLVTERMEKLRVRRTLEKFVSKPVADEILKNSEGYEHSLGGERRHATILFSDIRSFTSVSEQAGPVEVVEQLNEYFTAMVDEVMQHHGTLDKFVGDAIMAVYGAPLSAGKAEDAWRAVQTAAGMRARLAELQANWRAAGKPVLKIGVGINCGEVVVGNIGSPHRMEYTVIGDPVNVASRVEGLNKEFGTDILLTDAVYELVKEHVEVRLAGTTAVKGREQTVSVYALEKLRT